MKRLFALISFLPGVDADLSRFGHTSPHEQIAPIPSAIGFQGCGDRPETADQRSTESRIHVRTALPDQPKNTNVKESHYPLQKTAGRFQNSAGTLAVALPMLATLSISMVPWKSYLSRLNGNRGAVYLQGGGKWFGLPRRLRGAKVERAPCWSGNSRASRIPADRKLNIPGAHFHRPCQLLQNICHFSGMLTLPRKTGTDGYS
jgi:hypothetical protein